MLHTGTVASTATVSPSADWVQHVHNFTLAANVTSLSIEFATGTLANTDFVFLAGVQLEEGTFDVNSIPSFQHESFGDSLIRCQRYCQVFAGGAANDVFATGQAYGTTNWLCCLPFHTQMRTQPSVAYAGSASDFHVFTAVAGAAVCASVSATNFTADAVNLIGTTSSGLVAGNATMLRAQNTTATITVTSEI